MMIIYNTTYHVHDNVAKSFIEWLRVQYIPQAIACNTLATPQLALIMAKQEGDVGSNYSLQFKVESVDMLEKWYSNVGVELLKKMQSKFGNNVGGFTTIMDLMEI